MPTYDFQCAVCAEHFSYTIPYATFETATFQCPACQSTDVRRKIGRVRLSQGERAYLNGLANSENLNQLEENPQALGQMMRGIRDQIGAPNDPTYNDVVKRLEQGESVKSIDKDYQDYAS